jgi:hypothetical protein
MSDPTQLELIEAEIARLERNMAIDAYIERHTPKGLQELPASEVEAAGQLESVISPERAVQEAVEATKAGEFERTAEQQAQLEELTRLEAGRKAGALVSPGGRVDFPSGEPDDGPSRAQMLYNLFEDTELNVDDIFTRRPVMTAEALQEAQSQAFLEGEPLIEYVPDAMRFSLGGVETPLGAGIRVIGDSVAAAVEVAARHALTYEVGEAGSREPVDPDAFAYQAEQLGRSVLGDENYPSTLSTGGLGGPIAKVVKSTIGYDFSSDLRAGLQALDVPPIIVGFVSEGITMPAFGPVDHGSEAAQEMDPYGFRVADPSLDWNDQIVQNATVGRTLKDLFVDMPDVREAYKENYGSESAAFYGGILADLMIPDLTFVGGKVAKGVKAAGSVADVGLTALAGSRLAGGRAMREALLQGAEPIFQGRPRLQGIPGLQMAGDATKAATRGTARTGDEAIEALGEVVAREAVGPRALVDAVGVADELAEVPGELVRLAERVAPGSKSARWVAQRADDVGLMPALSEMRIAQGVSDIERVFDATLAAGKKLDTALDTARQAAMRAARALGGGSVPTSMAEAIQGASTARQLRAAVTEVVPANASVLDIGRAGSGKAFRSILTRADEPISGGADAARRQIAEEARRALGELVPRDMVAVTSKVMVPRRLAKPLRKLVEADVKGTFEPVEEGFRVVADRQKAVLEALDRIYPVNLRSGFWDDVHETVRTGGALRPDQTSRLSDALRSDSYLRLAKDPKTGRQVAEGLANVGKELVAATDSAIWQALSRNFGMRLVGAFGEARGAPAVYRNMGRAIGKETAGIPKRVADALRAAQKAGADDPFGTVADDLAREAGGFGEKFIEEAWSNTLGPLYGPLGASIVDLPKVARLMEKPPSMASLRAIDEIAQSVKDIAVELYPGTYFGKDFGSALAGGLFEAEAWVTSRKVAQRFIDDTPGLDLSLTPGLRGLDKDEVQNLVGEAIAHILEQGTTYARAPGRPTGVFDPDTPEFVLQTVMDSVGSALRTYGVDYLDQGRSAVELAEEFGSAIKGWARQPDGLDALLLVPKADTVLKRLIDDVDGAKALAESATVLRRSKDPADANAIGKLLKWGGELIRASSDLLLLNEPTRLVRGLFGPAIAVLAKSGAKRAIETTFPATKALAKQGGLKALETLGFDTSPIRRLGKSRTDPLFESGGRTWSQAQLDEEIARLGVGSSTRLSAGRRGRLVSDLMADLKVTMHQNKALRRVERSAQEIAKWTPFLSRMLPSIVDKVEQAFRREIFSMALKEGRTPELAADVAREAALDFEPFANRGAARLLQPILAGAVSGIAGLESLVRRPQEAMRIMRIMRAKQDYVEREYGGDEGLVGVKVPSIGPINMYGPVAAAYVADLLASAYYSNDKLGAAEGLLTGLVGGLGPVAALRSVSGGVQTWIEGEPTELTKDDEMLQVMLAASIADRYGLDVPWTPFKPWDVLVERYGLTATNIDKGGRTSVKIGRPARKGRGPGGEDIEAFYTYKMSNEGRKQFKADMAKANLFAGSQVLEAYKAYGVIPQVGLGTSGFTEQEVAERRMGEAVRAATGR